jgi:hypothetical protein
MYHITCSASVERDPDTSADTDTSADATRTHAAVVLQIHRRFNVEYEQ